MSQTSKLVDMGAFRDRKSFSVKSLCRILIIRFFAGQEQYESAGDDAGAPVTRQEGKHLKIIMKKA